VNLTQLNDGGSAIAAWIGGGALFDAAGSGTFTAPSFVLTNPYTTRSYNTIADALAALDTAVTDVSKQPGPGVRKAPQVHRDQPARTAPVAPALAPIRSPFTTTTRLARA
jgi:hypothetical protein